MANKAQSKNMKDTMAQAVQVQKNVNLILLQSDIKLKAIPNLPMHQQKARDHSNKWDNVWKGVLFTTSEFIDYATVFNESLVIMMDDVKTIKDPKSDEASKTAARNDIKSILEGVLETLTQKKKNASDQAAKVKHFHDAFKPDYQAFEADFKIARGVIAEDNKDLIDLNEQLDKAKDVAKKLEVGISVDSTVIPLTAEILPDEGPLAIVGAIILAVEVGGLVALLTAYADEMAKVKTLTLEIAKKKIEMAQLTGVEAQITGLQNASMAILKAAKNIESSWETLENDMNTLVQQVKSISPDQVVSLVENELKTTNEEWQKILKETESLRPTGGEIGRKQFKNYDEFLKAIKPKQK